MARISTYPISQPTVNDILIGSDADNLDVTKNYLLGDIIKLIPGGGLSVQSLNTLTGVVTLTPKGGLVITEVGNQIFLDASNVGQFDTLSTNGTTGAATLTAGVLNIPDYSSSGVTDVNSITGSVDIASKGGIVITEVGNVLFVDGANAGKLDTLSTNGTTGAATLIGGVLNIPDYGSGVSGVTDVNSITGSVNISSKGGIAITEVGNVLFVDGTNAGSFDSLTVNGTTGAATFIGGVLNVPQYQRAITVTTGGSGSASLIGANLNIPYEPISLSVNGTTGPATLVGTVLNIPQYGSGVSGVSDVNSITGSVSVQPKGGIVITEVGNVLFVDGSDAGKLDSLSVNGSSGAATLIGGVLNIPQYQRAVSVTTGGSGEATLIGANLNIPYLNSYNTGAPTVVSASAAGSSSIPTAASSGATVNMYSCTWSGGNGNYTLTLPSAVTDAYRSIRVITDGTFTNNTLQVILTPVFGQTINGASSVALNKQYTGILVWSDGSNWRVIQQIS